jgi:hypothetical protein
MITRLGLIIIMEPNIDAAVGFYQTLGLRLNFHLSGSWAEFDLPSGQGVKICLCPAAQEGDRRTGIVLEMTDVKGFYQQHKDDMVFLSEPLEKVHGIMVPVKDPGGNIIELYQPTPEKVAELVQQTKDTSTDQENRSCGKKQECCKQSKHKSEAVCC